MTTCVNIVVRIPPKPPRLDLAVGYCKIKHVCINFAMFCRFSVFGIIFLHSDKRECILTAPFTAPVAVGCHCRTYLSLSLSLSQEVKIEFAQLQFKALRSAPKHPFRCLSSNSNKKTIIYSKSQG